MTTGDMPTISSTNYRDSVSAAGAFFVGGTNLTEPAWGPAEAAIAGEARRELIARAGARTTRTFAPQMFQSQTEETPMVATAPTSRLVKVFIADADDNVPIDKRLLYRGDEKMTDLTDQELFFEVPITQLLTEHNEYRKTIEDKKAKRDKPVMLEPVRIRDLKMVVVVLANF